MKRTLTLAGAVSALMLCADARADYKIFDGNFCQAAYYDYQYVLMSWMQQIAASIGRVFVRDDEKVLHAPHASQGIHLAFAWSPIGPKVAIKAGPA